MARTMYQKNSPYNIKFHQNRVCVFLEQCNGVPVVDIRFLEKRNHFIRQKKIPFEVDLNCINPQYQQYPSETKNSPHIEVMAEKCFDDERTT